MHMLILLLIGAAAAAVAGWMTDHPLRLLGDLVVGAAGSVVGRRLFAWAGVPVDGLSGAFLVAMCGALALLCALRFLRPGRA